MASFIALFPDRFRSHKEWALEDIPTARTSFWRWVKAMNFGTLSGACVGVVVHFRKHPIDWSRARTVSFVQGMDRRNRWYPPLLGYWRSFNLQRLPMRKELMSTTGLWAVRCGSIFMVAYGLECALCVLTIRPYHSSWGINFFSGFAGGYVFSLSDIVPRKTRWLVAFSYGILFCLAAMYDGIPQEVSDEVKAMRQGKREKRLTIKMEETPRGMSPRELQYQDRLKNKMEKLYNASEDFASKPKGTYLGDEAYGNDYVFNYFGSFRQRAEDFNFSPWADPSTKRMIEERRAEKKKEAKEKEKETPAPYSLREP